MKKNMLPLLGIAFIVAIVSTGVFYGLFAGKLRSSSELPSHAIVVAARDLDRGAVIQSSDLRVSEIQGVLRGSFSKPEDAAGATLLASIKANEPLLEERVLASVSDATRAGGPVPGGMRAITLHIFQSESLLNMLRPGSRIDLQAVSDRNGGTELRTVLENVQVLQVSSADANGNRPAGAAVTVLVGARDADTVALADAGSRIRLALRNPMDEEITPRRPVSFAAVFSATGKLTSDAAESNHPAAAGVWQHPVQLHVQVLSVSDSGLAQLRAHTGHEQPDGSWRAAQFPSREEAAKVVQSLEQKRELEIVSGERLTAGLGRPISFHAGPKDRALRVQFSLEQAGAGKLSLHVKPRIGSDTAPELEFPDSASFLVEEAENDAPRAMQLFPDRKWEHRHLLILVSARALPQASTLASAGAHRGH